MSSFGAIPPLPSGMRLDSFEVIGPVGQGGQGRLYLVRQWRGDGMLHAWSRWRLRRLAARRTIDAATIEAEQLGVLKLAHPDFQANLLNEREYLAMDSIGHPHLIALYTRRFPTSTNRVRAGIGSVYLADGSGARHRYTYLALAYEPAGSLAKLLSRQRGRPLPLALAVTIAAQVADALDHLHRVVGVVHHDLCPENVVLRSEQPVHAVLIDLAAAESLSSPRQRSIYGHERYLPPERLADPPEPISVGVDIYSLGVLLFDMLGDQSSRQRRIDPQERLSAMNPAVPEELDRLVAQALDPDPERRLAAIPSAAAAAAALRAIPVDRTELQPRRPRRPAPLLAAGVAVVLLAVLLLFLAPEMSRGQVSPAMTPIVTVTPAPEPTLAFRSTATPVPTAAPAPTSTRIPSAVRPLEPSPQP
ncbi:MAG: protein kinase [Roseiflexaceae bacterium]|nr:protein kinase [Roseiflexaceae bacterium]